MTRRPVPGRPNQDHALDAPWMTTNRPDGFSNPSKSPKNRLPDGRGWEAVSLAAGRWYAALEFPWYLGNIDFLASGAPKVESAAKGIEIDYAMTREAEESES